MKYLIYGSNDFAVTLKDFLLYHEMNFSGFIDDFRTDKEICGTFKDICQQCSPQEYEIILGIGYKNLNARRNLMQEVKNNNFRLKTLIHKNSYVRCLENIGEGAIIMANAVVDANAIIGSGAVLWPKASVNHDSFVGTNTFLSPSVTVCGFVSIGNDCFIGAGSTIVDRVSIPDGTFIRAGELYFKNRSK